jgi:hypothetical protein
MNVLQAAREANRRAAQQNWHHFCDPTLAFSQPRYSQLIDLWKTKANGRRVPRRSELTARDLKDFLRDILLFQRISSNPSNYIWRIIGTSVSEIVGHHTGKTFVETFPPQDLQRWVETADMILESEQPWRMRGRVHIRGREYLDAENLYLPLADDNDVPCYLLGLCRYAPHVSDDGMSWEKELASIPGGLL